MNTPCDDAARVLLIAAWCILPAFFWIRGEWKPNAGDRLAGGSITGALFVLQMYASPGTAAGINCAGLWMFAMGIVTLLLAATRRRVGLKEALGRSIPMILLGAFLSMLMT